MRIIFIIIVAIATHGIFARKHKKIQVPSEIVFNDVINDNGAGFRDENGDSEAEMDIGQLLTVMQKNHKLIPIQEDDINIHNKDLIIKSLENIIEDIVNYRNNTNDDARISDDEEESDWMELDNKGNDKSQRDTIGALQFSYGRRRLNSRRSSTQGGYTHDEDTCRTYNDNLQKLWNTVSNYFTTSDVPSNKALHNIAIIVQAYLDHQHNKDTVLNTIPDTEIEKDNDDPMAEMISKIDKILSNDITNPVESIFEVISKELKANSHDNADCFIINEEYLRTSIDLTYQNYLENAGCHDEDSKALRQTKLDFDYVFISNKHIDQPLDGKGKGRNDDDKQNVDKLRSFHSGDSIYSKTSKNNKLRKIVDLYGDYLEDYPFKRSSFAKSKHNLRNQPDCQQIARHKFLDSLRPVIERFMNRTECELDATLRTSNDKSINPMNVDSKSSNSRNKYSLVSPFKIAGNNIFGENGENNLYNNITMQDNKHPMNNFHESRHNKEFNPLLFKLRDQILSNYKIPQPPRPKNELNVPKASSYVAASLTNDKKEYFNEYNNWNNNLYDRPAEVNYATTQKTIQYNNFLKPYQQDDNIKLYKLLFDDLAQRNLQNSGNDKYIQDKIRELQDYTENKRFKKNPMRSIHKRSADEMQSNFNEARTSNDEAEYVDLTYLIKQPKLGPQFLIKSRVPYEHYLNNKVMFNMINNDVEILKAVKHSTYKPAEVLIDNENEERKMQEKMQKKKDTGAFVFNYHNANLHDNNMRHRNSLNGFKSEDENDWDSEFDSGSYSESDSGSGTDESDSDSESEEYEDDNGATSKYRRTKFFGGDVLKIRKDLNRKGPKEK